MRRYQLIFGLTGFFILIDQLSKWLIGKYLLSPFVLVPNLLEIRQVRNTGIAFGFHFNYLFLIIFTVLLIISGVILSYLYLDFSNYLTEIIFSLLFAGALGNLIDRLAKGEVIDFISISRYPVFNLADIFITGGTILLFFFYSKIFKK